MKCIHCQHDSKFKERSNGHCPNCHRRFAFEPRTGDPMTDGVFHAAIERVSSRGSVRFQADHLYYEIRRRYRHTLSQKMFKYVLWFGVTTVLSVGFSAGTGFEWVVPLAVLGLIWFTSADRRRFPRGKFDALFKRYLAAHGAPKGLIERRSSEAPRSGERPLSSEEMLAYSFDRAVICDRPETVDLLLANQFHFENNCAVLAITGYPSHAFQTVRSMLRNNPRLVVVALHDASVAGCQLAHRLRNDPAWFKHGVPVLDFGLRPVHRKYFPHQHDRRERRHRVMPVESISNDEARWLTHSTLALAVVIPEQVIKRLFHAISVVEEHQDDSGGSSGNGGSSDSSSRFDGEIDISDGGGDSFG